MSSWEEKSLASNTLQIVIICAESKNKQIFVKYYMDNTPGFWINIYVLYKSDFCGKMSIELSMFELSLSLSRSETTSK